MTPPNFDFDGWKRFVINVGLLTTIAIFTGFYVKHVWRSARALDRLEAGVHAKAPNEPERPPPILAPCEPAPAAAE